MKVVFHETYYQVYTHDPASARGRLEAVTNVIAPHVEFITPPPATEANITAVHTGLHIEMVRQTGLYDISALAAGGAVQAAEICLTEPCFALIRPPGHHASAGSAWGFCYFNNMAIAVEAMKRADKIESAFILDFDLHYGDGTVNTLGKKDYVSICNVEDHDRNTYMDTVIRELNACRADLIGVSAGFDNHLDDWGGLLYTEDYRIIGRHVRRAAVRNGGGCFGILEGGYNHDVLGRNVQAFIEGLSKG